MVFVHAAMVVFGIIGIVLRRFFADGSLEIASIWVPRLRDESTHTTVRRFLEMAFALMGVASVAFGVSRLSGLVGAVSV